MLVTTPFIDEVFGFDRDFGSLFGLLSEYRTLEGSTTAPPVDVAEAEEEIRVVAELPGVVKEDVRISLEKGILTITGERKKPAEAGGSRLVSRERSAGKFSRSVRIPWEVNAAAVSAELSDGLLKIVLPKAEAAKAHEITVR